MDYWVLHTPEDWLPNALTHSHTHTHTHTHTPSVYTVADN